MISFESFDGKLPSNNTLIPDGQYKAVIAEAQMTESKTAGKPKYLKLSLDVYGEDNKKLGRVWDNLTESTSEYVLYKLKCFCDSIGFAANKFELSDLSKVCKGKTVLVTINEDKNSDQPRNQVNIFKNPYAPCTEEIGFAKADTDEEIPFATPQRSAQPAETSAEDY